MAQIPRPLLYEIHAAAVKAGLDRSTLLAGVDASFVAGLREESNRSGQLLSDLTELDRTEQLVDKTWPLASWLQNALALAGPRVEAEVFRRGLEALGLARPAPPPAPASPVASKTKTKILFLGANPSNLTVRALGAEVRQIGGALRKADMGDRFQVEQAWAPRASDLQQCLLEHKPFIVHFSGHGTPDGKIVLEDAQGRSFEVPPNALTRLFQILRDNIRCVVLNACASMPQAEAIAKHIDCVVGMSTTITDAHAISFSTAFYRALGFGRTVREAFELGCTEVALEGLAETDIPVLLCRAGVRPEDVRLVREDQAG